VKEGEKTETGEEENKKKGKGKKKGRKIFEYDGTGIL